MAKVIEGPSIGCVCPMDFSAFLASANLTRNAEGLKAIGCAVVADLHDLTDEECTSAGMKPLEIKRMRRNLDGLTRARGQVKGAASAAATQSQKPIRAGVVEINPAKCLGGPPRLLQGSQTGELEAPVSAESSTSMSGMVVPEYNLAQDSPVSEFTQLQQAPVDIRKRLIIY
eukprot:SAG25_NODE_4705_length_765_cov_0.720721_1_plen_171_part_01